MEHDRLKHTVLCCSVPKGGEEEEKASEANIQTSRCLFHVQHSPIMPSDGGEKWKELGPFGALLKLFSKLGTTRRDGDAVLSLAAEKSPNNLDSYPVEESLHRENPAMMICEDEALEKALKDLIGDSFHARRLADKLNGTFNNNDHLELFTTLCRVQQLESWDCGIACILIILRWIHNSKYSSVDDTRHGESSSSSKMSDKEAQQYRALRVEIDTESIWTADLIVQLDLLLRNTTTRYLFCSKTFQVEEEYKHVGYYQAAFGGDEQRVTSIFAKLKSDLDANMRCAPQGISFRVVLNAVCHPNCIALVLIDNAILCRRFSPPSPSYHSYVGHYLLLVGVSRDPEHLSKAREWDNTGGSEWSDSTSSFCVVLCDPGQERPALSFVTPARFERSWRAKGTDEDIIFVTIPII